MTSFAVHVVVFIAVMISLSCRDGNAFTPILTSSSSSMSMSSSSSVVVHATKKTSPTASDDGNNSDNTSNRLSRRDVFGTTVATVVATSMGLVSGTVVGGGDNNRPVVLVPPVQAVGTLPELADTNAFLQGITINVADGDQQKMMINFLVKSFDMEILRQTVQDSVEETWLGYGPEQLSIPDNFEIPVSSFNKYGGHASINVRYDTQSIAPFYRQGDDPPGNNIAYLQLGVPGYRISQMIEYKGKIIDAYGLVNVVSPSGLPIRGIVGISPDPIMFVAINCRDVQESKVFYENLGFVEQDVPYSRPSKGTTMFEPAPPKGSCYMSPSGNTTTGMGILLLSGGKKNKSVIANPAVGSLNIVYNPSSSPSSSEMTEEGKNLTLKDPSGVSVKFISDGTFSATEKRTR